MDRLRSIRSLDVQPMKRSPPLDAVAFHGESVLEIGISSREKRRVREGVHQRLASSFTFLSRLPQDESPYSLAVRRPSKEPACCLKDSFQLIGVLHCLPVGCRTLSHAYKVSSLRISILFSRINHQALTHPPSLICVYKPPVILPPPHPPSWPFS